MEHLGAPEITVETVWRTILVTDARDSSKAYFSERSDEALVRIERDRALFARIAAAHGGEEARDRGDGSMFAFPDPGAAVRAAMMMQLEMARLNAALPAHALRLVHRMGVQMGSVKVATTGGEVPRRKLSGDIVVTAARLEGICHPGEVCLANDVYRAIKGSIDHGFRSLDATLKGFDRPVRVWSTRLDRNWVRPLTTEEERAKTRHREERRLRERWEREQRENRRRRLALASAGWAALLSLGCAAASHTMTQRAYGHESSVAVESEPELAMDFPSPTATLAVARRRPWTAIPAVTDARTPLRPDVLRPTVLHTVVRRTVAADRVRPARSRVTALVRQALGQGRFEDLSSGLLDIGLPVAEYQSLCEDARQVEAARDWLQRQLEDTATEVTPGFRLEPAIAGLTRLTRVDGGAVYGLNEKEIEVPVSFYDLDPEALGELLRAVAPSVKEAPDDPDAAVRSLAALRHRAGR